MLYVHLQCRRPWVDSWVREICWRRDRLPTPVFFGFPGSSAGKESACNAGDHGSIPGSERSTEKGIGYPLQYSSASLVAQLVTNLPAVEETWVQSLAWEDPVEKGKATHSSILAWRIPWTVLYCIVHGVASSWTRLSDFQFHFHGCWERLKAGREGDNRG